MAGEAPHVAITARGGALWAAAVLALSVGGVMAPLAAEFGELSVIAATASVAGAGALAGFFFKRIYPKLSWKGWGVCFVVLEFLAFASVGIHFALVMMFAQHGVRFGGLALHVMLALAIGVHFARAAQTPSPAPIAAMTMLCVAAWLYLSGLTFLSTPSVDAQSVAALMLSRGALAFILVAASVLSGVTLVAVSRIADNARLSHGLNIAGNLATVLFVLLGTPMAAMIV